jgi:ParB family chromosome partitioning protein
MKDKQITLMADREYRLIPMDSIVVLNSRSRNRQKFSENIRSINDVGLRKPIVVNGRGYNRTGKYELVCGEGRYLAHRELGKTEIAAELIDCDRKTALLYSLVENIARVPPGTMWFAYEVKRMHDAGLSYAEISRFVGRSSTYVSNYVQLVEQGENRLIEGVEQGLFPMSFAMQVALSDDSTIQTVLMDAFDDGMINSSTVRRVRKLLELRMNRGKAFPKRSDKADGYTLRDLTKEITKSTREKEDFVRETQRKENRLLSLLMGISTLMEDPEGLRLITEAGLGTPPRLQGSYGVDLRQLAGEVCDD